MRKIYVAIWIFDWLLWLPMLLKAFFYFFSWYFCMITSFIQMSNSLLLRLNCIAFSRSENISFLSFFYSNSYFTVFYDFSYLFNFLSHPLILDTSVNLSLRYIFTIIWIIKILLIELRSCKGIWIVCCKRIGFSMVLRHHLIRLQELGILHVAIIFITAFDDEYWLVFYIFHLLNLFYNLLELFKALLRV